MYFSPVPPGLQWNMKSRNIFDSYSICKNITPNPRPGVKSSYQILMRLRQGEGRIKTEGWLILHHLLGFCWHLNQTQLVSQVERREEKYFNNFQGAAMEI